MLNFLYCLDEKYNLQALNSINSLLENSSEKVNLYIIHKNSFAFEELIKKIPNFKTINSLNIYSFSNKNINFPDLNGAHVSEATYYRMLIDEYVPENLDFIVYLDADIICLNDPCNAIKKEIEIMKVEDTPLGAKTEGTRENSSDLFNHLGLVNDNHFNAGVIIINFQKWKSNNTKLKLLQKMEERKDKIIYWDQDLLNIVFDDDYTKINSYLNFNHSVFNKETIEQNKLLKIIFLHYSGKSKPWGIDNVLNKNSTYYQDSFRKLGVGKYHIVFDKRYKTFKNFVKILFSFKFLNLEYPYEYIKKSFLSFLK